MGKDYLQHYVMPDIQYIGKRFTLYQGNDKKQTISDKDITCKSGKTWKLSTFIFLKNGKTLEIIPTTESKCQQV